MFKDNENNQRNILMNIKLLKAIDQFFAAPTPVIIKKKKILETNCRWFLKRFHDSNAKFQTDWTENFSQIN